MQGAMSMAVTQDVDETIRENLVRRVREQKKAVLELRERRPDSVHDLDDFLRAHFDPETLLSLANRDDEDLTEDDERDSGNAFDLAHPDVLFY
jgi:hypothetical protein